MIYFIFLQRAKRDYRGILQNGKSISLDVRIGMFNLSTNKKKLKKGIVNLIGTTNWLP